MRRLWKASHCSSKAAVLVVLASHSERYSCCPASSYGVSGVVTRVPGTQCSVSSSLLPAHRKRQQEAPFSVHGNCLCVLNTLLVSHQLLVEHPPVNLQKEN